MSALPFSCPVRGCGLPLAPVERRFACAGGHSFDLARSGYLNLLQPTDRRSPEAGDSKAAVDARARLAQSGIGAALLDTVVRTLSPLVRTGDAIVTDLGSGTGDALAGVARALGIGGIGIDLSTAAATHAARRFPHLAWVVANADRRLPLLDGSVALVLSLHARRNPAECARIIPSGGHLLVAVPAPDDLIELREAVQGQRVARDRADAVMAEHEPWFVLAARTAVRERRSLDAGALRDVLQGTYRGARARHASMVDALHRLEVTLASDLLLFARR